jgi:Sec-independent protein translocase protein TatA
MDLGMGEILLILLVALLVYGGRLPEVARSLGRSVASVKRSLSETTAKVTREIDVAAAIDEEDRPRTVRRVHAPAPEALAKEDVSGTAAPGDADAPPA